MYVKSGDCSAPPQSLPLPQIEGYAGTTRGYSTPIPSSESYFVYEDYIHQGKRPPYSLAKRFVKLSESYRIAGRADLAVKTLKSAIPVLRAHGDRYKLGTAYERLGLAYRDMDNLTEARSKPGRGLGYIYPDESRGEYICRKRLFGATVIG